jgi:hypothetical protein
MEWQFNYKAIAASQTASALGAPGGLGDWIESIIIIPATTSPGAVSIADGGGSAITLFAGGATSVQGLAPFQVLVEARSRVGGWTVTTGANVSVVATGLWS